MIVSFDPKICTPHFETAESSLSQAAHQLEHLPQLRPRWFDIPHGEALSGSSGNRFNCGVFFSASASILSMETVIVSDSDLHAIPISPLNLSTSDNRCPRSTGGLEGTENSAMTRSFSASVNSMYCAR